MVACFSSQNIVSAWRRSWKFFGSEEEIFVVCCVQNVGRALVVIVLIQTQLGLPGSRQLFLLLLDFLLLILDLFQPEEFFSLKLIQFADNVSQSPLNLRNNSH